MLLADAVRRACASATTVVSSMLVVDAINDRAAAFYEGNDHLRALAQRVAVVDPSEIRIMGSKTELLRTLAAAASVEAAAVGVRSFIPKWRTRHDSNV